MPYATYFEGELKIQLSEQHCKKVKAYIHKFFKSQDIVNVTKDTLRVNGELSNGNGIMEDIVLLIEKYGTLLSGEIDCDDEDPQDHWKIVILENRPFIQECRSSMRLNRVIRREKSVGKRPDINEIKLYRIV